MIARRFLSIFYPAAEYQKIQLVVSKDKERFFASFKVLLSEGYLKVAGKPAEKTPDKTGANEENEKIVFSYLKKLAEQGHTVIAVSHNEAVKDYADEIVEM